MPVRYIAVRARPAAKVRADIDWAPEPHMSMQVIEDDPEPVDPGLYDQHGTRLFRVVDREPIGFKVR